MKRLQAEKKEIVLEMPTLGDKVEASLVVGLGYVAGNFATYMLTLWLALEYIVKCLETSCPEDISFSADNFFGTNTSRLVLGITTAGNVALAISNQSNYYNNRLKQKGKITSLDDKSDNQSWGDIVIKLSNFFGTHMKSIASGGAFSRGTGQLASYLGLKIPSFYIVLPIYAISLTLGQKAQFAFLGQKHREGHLNEILKSFFSTLFWSSMVYLSLEFSMRGDEDYSPTFFSCAFWFSLLFADTIVVTLKDKSSISFAFEKVKNCVKKKSDPERDPLLSSNNNSVWAGGKKPKTPHHSDGENTSFISETTVNNGANQSSTVENSV